MPIKPHGGVLVNRLLEGAALAAAREKAAALPRIKVDGYMAFEIDGIAKGLYSPLTGFMNEEQTRRVLDTMHLRPGVPWTFPLLLHVSQDEADRLGVGQEVAIEDDRGDIVAILRLSEKFSVDKRELAEKVYRTLDEKHPGVAYTFSHGPVYLAGDLDVLQAREIEHQEFNLTPAQTRAAFIDRGWKRIVAFQTRNPIHRAHEYLTKCALEICDGLLIHPLMGTTKSDDIPGDVRMACYKALMEKYYAPDHVMLSIMPVNMRYAGPKEAIMHAIIRKNYGCTHFIVGRDHAGVGNYYGTYDAHYIFDEFDREELDITPLFFEHAFFSKITGGMASPKTCPGGPEDHVFLSGTKVREMLQRGEMPPEEFTRPEVARVLIDWATGAK
ncbi:MAG TPA: sulfate adenylyltransferase [Candidatus Hydrogenedentes bacterium]|nr:sulfate adenylyltransferase [Candidatus Hydrogenedentota bacterium]HNT86915.1 sulfate adenylyltransferase [Candidatus Hydrogenedentota bacterium]